MKTKLWIRNPASGLLQMGTNWKNGNDVTIFWHDMTSSNFWCCFVSFVKFSYWSKFHVNIITGSEVLTNFFYKGLTRNPEIGILSSEFCPISGHWGELGIPNLVQMSPIKCYWMLENVKVTAFTIWVIMGKPTGGKITPSPD